ncbi:MAG: TonB-dependent receptor plug domain-containing protein, partial [Pseudomonadota bacterium]
MQFFCNITKYYFHFLVLFLILFSLTSSLAFSSDKHEVTTDYFELGLEELMNLDVTVASINPESIVKTPAIVSSYSAKDLEKMGLRSLREMLSFIPGLFVQSSNIPMDSLMVRGVSETYNQKILLLIDDVPYWGSSHSQIPLLGLPLEAIDHIEVIRGPGAVIYGTNASAGVIKVVTKKFSANNSVTTRAGSHNHVNGSGFYSTSFSDSVDLSVGFEIQNEKGYQGFFQNEVKLPYLPDDQQTSGSIREKMEMKSLLAKLRVDNLNILLQAFESVESGSLGAAPTHPEKPAIGESNGYILHADYNWDLEKTTVKAYSDYNVAYTEAYESEFLPGVERLVQFSNSGKDNYRWGTGLTLNHKISDDLSIFAGSEFEHRSVGDYKMYLDNVPVITQLEKQNIREIS